jgi:geranylgeranyl diphosphate synthase type II
LPPGGRASGTATQSSAPFPEHLLALVDADLARLAVPGGDRELEAFDGALRYPLLAGGKRLRPVLLLATAEALGADPPSLLPAAVALECVHTFSLVHDDLPALDDDDLRRGRPTVHVAFGEDVAVLVGDALLTVAFRLLAERQAGPAERRLAATATLARAVDGMIRGQYLDVRAGGDLDEAGLRLLCGLKTGCLIEAAVGLALDLVGPPEETAAAYRALAAEIGLGFQIVDDVLDATGSDAVLGKRAGADADAGRRTHVTVLGLARARELAAGSERRARELVAALPGQPRSLQAIVERVYRRDR